MSSPSRTPATNVYRMMERLGIDAAGGVVDHFGLAFTCAARACEGCEAVTQCVRWLNENEPMRGPPAFCPNGNLLFELACRYPHVGTARIPAITT